MCAANTGAAAAEIMTAADAIAAVNKDVSPLPPEVANLPTYEAELWVQLADDPSIPAEGPCFDKDGNLYVTTISKGLIYKVTPEKKVSLAYENTATKTTSCAFHKDGRLFIVGTDNNIMYQNKDGSFTKIETRSANGKPDNINDLIFDSNGNLYVTDSDGTAANPVGGVYRFNADFTECVAVIENLAMPNGICLSPDEKVLWVTESGRNALLRAQLNKDGVSLTMFDGLCYAFYGTGAPGGTDGVRTDSAGYVYDAIQLHGRILIFSPTGVPVANVLIPGREEGKYLGVANVTIKPDTNEGYVVAGGGAGKGPSVFKFTTLNKALTPFSHQ
jgi:lactonase